MAFRVPISQLPELANWLKPFLPDSSRPYGLAVSTIRGLEQDEFWADKWPDITTVLVKPPHHNGEKLRDKYMGLTVYTTDAKSCRSLLETDGLIDWNEYFIFQAVPLEVKMCIDDICNEKCISSTVTNCGITECFTGGKDDAMTVCAIENGFTLGPLTGDDAQLVASRWEFVDPYGEEYISHFIKTYPSAGVRDPSDSLVGWVIVNRDWIPGMLYVEPEFRKKGFGAAIFNHVTNAIRKEGMINLSRIVVDNEASFSFHSKCGYEVTRESGCYYVSRCQSGKK